MSDETQNVQEENAEHTPTPHKSTVFKLLYALLIAIPIISLILLVIIHISSPHCSSEITADGMIEFVVGGLSCISTIALAAVTVWHTEILQRENDSAQQRLEDMAKDANDISRELVQMNERANELAKNANELNMITVIIENQTKKYQRLEQLLYRYSELMDSNNVKSYLLNVVKANSDSSPNYLRTKKNEFASFKNEAQHLASEIRLIIMQENRNIVSRNDLNDFMKELDSAVFNERIRYETDTPYLDEVEQCRMKYISSFRRYLLDYSKDIDSAMYKPMTLAQVRNLFNPENEENTENGQDENGIPESDSGKH